MAPTAGVITAAPAAGVDMAEELFTLNVKVIEAAGPVAELLRSTSDNCGSTCSGTACTSFTDDPA
jgi:FxLD family lantipeptide